MLSDIHDKGNKKAGNWPLGIYGNGKCSNKNAECTKSRSLDMLFLQYKDIHFQTRSCFYA